MKVRTSVMLSEELLQAISHEVKPRSRSAFIDEASWILLRERRKEIALRRDADDLVAAPVILHLHLAGPFVAGAARQRVAELHGSLTAARHEREVAHQAQRYGLAPHGQA